MLLIPGINCEPAVTGRLYDFVNKKVLLKWLHYKNGNNQATVEEKEINLWISPHKAEVLRYETRFYPFALKVLYAR